MTLLTERSADLLVPALRELRGLLFETAVTVCIVNSKLLLTALPPAAMPKVSAQFSPRTQLFPRAVLGSCGISRDRAGLVYKFEQTDTMPVRVQLSPFRF